MRKLRVVAALASLALLVAGLSAVAITRPDRKESAPAVPALASEPFVVTLSAGLSGSTTIVGSSVLLGSQAIGLNRTVVALELWDGGRLVQRTAGSHAAFTWQPLLTGPHLLHARGIAQDGKTARSAPVAIDVAGLPIKVPPVPVTAAAGERGADIATRLGVAPARVKVRTAAGVVPLAPTAVVPAGANPLVEVTSSVQPPIPLGEPDVVVQPAPAESSGTPIGPPPAPELKVPQLFGPTVSLAVSGCDVTVKVTGTGGRTATLEQAFAGRPGFVQGGTRNGDGSITLKKLVPGVQLIDVSTSEGVSSPVSATVPTACAASPWKGDSSLVSGILTIPKASPEVYVYLGVDDKPFVRVPASHDEFLDAPTPRLDISKLLPALTGKKLVMEVWHRVDGNPSQFGTGTLEATDERSLQDVIGEPTAVDLKVITPQGHATSYAPEEDGLLQFRWTAASPRVSGVMWQVLAAPLTTSNVDVSPYSTVAAGFSMSTQSGAFTVDTTKLPRSDGKPVVLELAPPDITSKKPSLAKPKSSDAKTSTDLDDLAPPVVGRFWVRVLPLVHTDGQLFDRPMGIASSNVVIDLPPPPKPPAVTYKVAKVDLSVGAVANLALRSCIRVTRTPWNGPQKQLVAPTQEQQLAQQAENAAYGVQAAVARAFYPVPGTYCDGDFKKVSDSCDDSVFCVFEDIVSAVVDLVGKAWDLVAAAYNGIIDLAVTLFAKFNPICAALSIAKSSASDTCEAIASVVGRTAISAVLAAYGLPPSLPTTKDLTAIAQGDLSVLAVELMKELGIPCDSLKLDSTQSQALIAGGKAADVDIPSTNGKVDACLYAASYMIGKVKEQVIRQTQSSVAAAAGLPYFDVPGFEFIPEPKGHLSPTVLTVYAVPSRPLGALEALFAPPCQIGADVRTQSGIPAPFKNGIGRLHRVPSLAPSDPLAGFASAANEAAAGVTGIPKDAWVEQIVMSTPSSPNLDVDSVFEGMTLTGAAVGSCLTNAGLTDKASYGPPLNR